MKQKLLDKKERYHSPFSISFSSHNQQSTTKSDSSSTKHSETYPSINSSATYPSINPNANSSNATHSPATPNTPYSSDREAYLAALKRSGIPEFEEGSPRSEFGTREEHKMVRAHDWGDMQRRGKE